MTFQLSITADTVAWYGAIVATLGGIVSIISVIFTGITVWRDRSRIKITYSKKSVRVFGVGVYDNDKAYFNITIRNVGRRTIAIGNVIVKMFQGDRLLMNDSVNGMVNKILTEQNPRAEFFADIKGMNFLEAHYIQVFDETGKEYRKYFSLFPTFKKYFYLLTHKNHEEKSN